MSPIVRAAQTSYRHLPRKQSPSHKQKSPYKSKRNKEQKLDLQILEFQYTKIYNDSCMIMGKTIGWCADTWHFNYQNAPTDGRVWVSGCVRDLRVLRGGSWLHLPESCRSAQRFKSAPHNK